MQTLAAPITYWTSRNGGPEHREAAALVQVTIQQGPTLTTVGLDFMKHDATC